MRLKSESAMTSTMVSPAVARMLESARRSGRDPAKLVSLVRGEPDFETPDHIRRAAWEALEAGYTHYPATHGYSELRQAVADRIRTDQELDFDPDREVLITDGATAGMYLALLAVLEEGRNEVILPDPIYDAYANQVRVLGGKPVFFQTRRSNAHFHIDTEVIEAALTPRTRAVILNTPWNPTGTVLSKEELHNIGELVLQHDLIAIVDEIYGKIVYESHVHCSLVGLSAALRDHVITVNSLSKTYAMTGWRLGYNLASSSLTRTMKLHYEQFSRGSPAFVQRAGIAALRGSQDVVTQMVAEYAERRRLMVDQFASIAGVECIAPEGTFFCLVDVRDCGQNSEELARYLVREWGLLTVPGSYYGPSLEGYLRISFSYAREDILRGLELLAQAVHHFSA
jgi:aspartate/methionine/tyrosine aminotransferase